MFERSYTDILRQNPLMKNPLPPRIRTHQLIRVPIMYDEPESAQPKFRWMTSNWYVGEPEPHMKEWDERYRSTLNRMQGMY